MRLVFETDDEDADLFVQDFQCLLNTCDNEEGVMISAEMIEPVRKP